MSLMDVFLGGRVIVLQDTFTVGWHNITVPAGRRWLLLAASVYNGATTANTCHISVTHVAGGTGLLANFRLASGDIPVGGMLHYPNNVASLLACNRWIPLVLQAGDRVRFDVSVPASNMYMLLVLDVPW